MGKKSDRQIEEVIESINLKLPASTADWLRGAAAMTQTTMFDLANGLLADGLGRLEKEQRTTFPRIGPKRR